MRPAKRIRGHTPHTASRPHAFLPAAPCDDASCEVSGDEVFDSEEASCGRVRVGDVPYVAGFEHAADRAAACCTVRAAAEDMSLRVLAVVPFACEAAEVGSPFL